MAASQTLMATGARLPPRFFRWPSVVGLLLWLLGGGAALALNAEDLLPAERAFRGSARIEGDVALLRWDIADGYYLYRKKFKFVPQTPGVAAGSPEFPQGETKYDEYFGEMEIYRRQVEVRLPLTRTAPTEKVALDVTVQGCADAGLCYPPHKQRLQLSWPGAPAPTAAGASAPPATAGDPLAALGVKSPAGHGELLPADQAFRFHAEVKDAGTLWLGWQIADGYYLYREKFKLALPEGAGARLGDYAIPRGEPRHDQEFGAVEIFHREVGFTVPLIRADGAAGVIELAAEFQGCAERGVCYPPMRQTARLELPAAPGPASGATEEPATAAAPSSEPGAAADAAAPGTGTAPSPPAGACEIGPASGFVEPSPASEQCAIADSLKKDSIWLTAASFLGMGLLLAFTPCIFPMIPILSGIIVGHGHRLTTGRALLLSLSYVVASALAYTVFGVLAGLFGANLQALFQEPWIIAAFSALFVALALSMFGVFNLQIPGFIQSRVAALSNQQHGGTLAGAAVMGALSALIVGPCVAAPLAGALIYIGQTGDAVLGGFALFALGLGMGLPLLVIGASAGRWLPRAGIWMNSVKAGFGVGLLGIAVWLLDRVVPPPVSMLLWALLLIIPAIFLGALDALPQPASGWRKLWKGVGIAMLAYGVLLLIGVAANATDPLQPLRGLAAASGAERVTPESLAFRKVKSLTELNREIDRAEAAGRWVMLDFYADWCVSCKEMERYTFTDAGVREALREVVLLQADVTANSDLDQALLRNFALIGPPATLFFGPDRAERKAFRVVGYMDAEAFLGHVRKVIR